MQKLPLGIQTLRKIRQENRVYVDKTGQARRLIDQGGAFFLSRPRRFGKSLFVDTLKEIFEGNQKLFKGLCIHDHWDWSTTFPVIKIDFAGGTISSRQELDERILKILSNNAERLDVEVAQEQKIPARFEELIQKTEQRHGNPVVVLVDEYDKPILDNIALPEIATEIREGLKNFYSVLKEQDAHIRFIFMTGVSKFSKVSLFSGLNQLTDITLAPDFATICGYTQEDLEISFAEHLQGVDRDRLQQWYNGYRWQGTPVYNPYDILLFINQGRMFRNYWFETGTPSFLIRLLENNRYFLPDLEVIEVGEEVLLSFDVERINPVTLLFQTGYLTITGTSDTWGETIFTLQAPNKEVRQALNTALINGYAGLDNSQYGIKKNLVTALRTGNLEAMVQEIRRLFAAIPWRNFANNDLPETEGYYASVLYAFFASLNAEIIPEDTTNHGQIDMTIKMRTNIYIMEIKTTDSREINHNPALEQITDRAYAQKYKGIPDIHIHEVGLVFSKAERNLIKADWLSDHPSG